MQHDIFMSLNYYPADNSLDNDIMVPFYPNLFPSGHYFI